MTKSMINSGEHSLVAGPVGCLPAEDYLWQKYRLRRNVLSGKVEYRKVKEDDSAYRHLCDKELKSILLQSKRDGYVEEDDITADLKLLIDSADIPAYDPIRSWLESLQWDGKERLVDFWQRIPGVTAEQIYWLNIWMRYVVAQWLGISEEHGNECVPMLIGSQDQGKSTFLVRLLPPQFRAYFLDNIRLNNNFDKDIALSRNLLVNLDEFDHYNASQQANIKHILSKVRVNGRQAYGRTQEDLPRYASFTATTNNPRPLTDPTGTRRFICLSIPKGKYLDNDTAIDYEQLYAQIMHELMVKHERYWFTHEEIARIQMVNAPYQAVRSLEQMVNRCVRPLQYDETERFFTIDDVICKLKELFVGADETQYQYIKVGKVLRNLGFVRQHQKHGNRYLGVIRENI